MSKSSSEIQSQEEIIKQKVDAAEFSGRMQERVRVVGILNDLINSLEGCDPAGFPARLMLTKALIQVEGK